MNYRDIADLLKAAAVNWVKDYAQSMGAALAFYTMFSIAPLLLIVISVAGLVFGEEAARGEIFSQMDGMLGAQGALAVQGLLETARRPAEATAAGAIGLVVLFIGATSVFAELQDALDRIWRAPARARSPGLWGLLRARLLSFGMILGIGFLLMVSLAFSAGLAALNRVVASAVRRVDRAWRVRSTSAISVVLSTLVFAMIYKAMPRVRHRLEGRLDRRRVHGGAVRRRQVPDRRLHRPDRHLVRASAPRRRSSSCCSGCTTRRRSSCSARNSRGCTRTGSAPARASACPATRADRRRPAETKRPPCSLRSPRPEGAGQFLGTALRD